MNKLGRLFQIITLSIFVMMSGCSYNNVYEIDKTADGKTEEIIGIHNIYDAGANNVNILFIHGMGFHPPEKELGKGGGDAALSK